MIRERRIEQNDGHRTTVQKELPPLTEKQAKAISEYLGIESDGARITLIEQIRNAPEGYPVSVIVWIPVEEQLPEDCLHVWAWCPGVNPIPVYRFRDEWHNPSHDGLRVLFEPTHWSPIPEVRDG